MEFTQAPLGIEYFNGKFLEVTQRYCTIPCKKKILITNREDGQEEITINILMGQSGIAKENL